ncbi:hypothetical protein BVY01_00550 [bacterium I07]|nr:hypothetical protein BVY01_00550 [bacterium I07]
MRTSIVASTQPASFSAVAYKGELEQSLQTIAGLGYDGVELAVRDPNLLDIEDLTCLIKKNQLKVPAIGTGQAFGEEGLCLSHDDMTIRQNSIKRLLSHIDLASRFDAVVIVGLIRGQSCPAGKTAAESRIVEGLQACADHNAGVRLVIEPINRYETEFINTVESGLVFLDKVNRNNVGLLLDTFHMNIEEPSMERSLKLAGNKVFHVHLADSNRWYPGAGHIDFRSIFQTLSDMDYNDYVSAEIMPLPDAQTAAEKTMETLSSLLF